MVDCDGFKMEATMRKWIRTCQSCGNIQEDKKPDGDMTDPYAFRKCKRCKSMDLDYGKWESNDETTID